VRKWVDITIDGTAVMSSYKTELLGRVKAVALYVK